MNTETHFVGKIAQKAIIVDGEKVLITRDRGDEVFELPGGRMNEGENLEEALVREVKEEIGITISPRGIIHAEIVEHTRDKTHQLFLIWEVERTHPDEVFTFDPQEVAEHHFVDKYFFREHAYYPYIKNALEKYFGK